MIQQKVRAATGTGTNGSGCPLTSFKSFDFLTVTIVDIKYSKGVFTRSVSRSSFEFTKMSDTSSLAENSSEELSDNNDEEYAVEVEDFDPQNAVAEAIPLDQRGIIVPYADEPIADEAWLAGYRQRREAERQ